MLRRETTRPLYRVWWTDGGYPELRAASANAARLKLPVNTPHYIVSIEQIDEKSGGEPARKRAR